MKYIANILTQKAFSDKELYNVVSKKEDLIEGIPTLVIGWEYTKKVYPEANVLDWKINDNVYWTFGIREKRQKFDINIENFRKIALNRFINSTRYRFLNVLTASEEEKGVLFNILNNSESVAVYFNNNMAYIYDTSKNEVIGVSISDIEYEGKDKKKFFSKIYRNPNISVVEMGNEISEETKSALKNYKYVIPYLYSER